MPCTDKVCKALYDVFAIFFRKKRIMLVATSGDHL